MRSSIVLKSEGSGQILLMAFFLRKNPVGVIYFGGYGDFEPATITMTELVFWAFTSENTGFIGMEL